MKTWIIAGLMACMGSAGLAETTAATLFSAKPLPTAGEAQPVGAYGKGCAAGNVELAETGPTWQAMRLSRNRNWGQPVTVAYLMELSAAVQAAGWRGLYIGDIGNPRGGPMNSGHASHQMGLDVDIWFSIPDRLDHSRREREKMSAISIRSDDQLSVNGNWDPSYREVLRLAAQDPRVDRIFVAAAIKIEMCKTATPADKAWLQKIRPEANHEDHMHVRLKCPKGSPLCERQKPTVAELSNGGDGCDDTLMWWVSDAYLHPKPSKTPVPAAPRKKGARQLLMSDLPAQCAAVLSAN
ncbi:penicillin-insensitive murein endopeptidase [Rhodobacter sp. KR11]|uniref:penicillin-insensitive murein endopeptidase n=1 Tax=Rhodobacter sp. KR11 TaxID=2974588 RepID=UPI0022226761|nr:penicillin-insensitive murein endopeptidase [Rhodobacter sp. KR11]MCW1918946.1 penicillin-insensitive murein endopeptidase [Rhodobacter sp. KR11]